MKKATIVLFALFFGFSFLTGVSFACGGHHGNGEGQEMIQPGPEESEGHICPHRQSNQQKAPTEGLKGGTARERFQNVPKAAPQQENGDDHQCPCPHHK